jgi:AcrR family transcriptional regulator
VTARLPRNQRSDARDNRDRILDATRSAFVTDGLDVPIREIARRAVRAGVASIHLLVRVRRL